MNQQYSTEIIEENFKQMAKAMSDVPGLDMVKTAAQQNLTAQKEFYTKSAAVFQLSGNASMDLVDTTWATTKMLNKKLLENVTTNSEAAFAAAQRAAAAKSLPELASIQSDYLQSAMERASTQTKDFFELWTRASENALEQTQKAMMKSSS